LQKGRSSRRLSRSLWNLVVAVRVGGLGSLDAIGLLGLGLGVELLA
jgi:hypothetical protein